MFGRQVEFSFPRDDCYASGLGGLVRRPLTKPKPRSETSKPNYCRICSHPGTVRCKCCRQWYCDKRCRKQDLDFHQITCAKTFSERVQRVLRYHSMHKDEDPPNVSFRSPCTAFIEHDSDCFRHCVHCLVCHKPMNEIDVAKECVVQMFPKSCNFEVCRNCNIAGRLICGVAFCLAKDCPDHFKFYRKRFRTWMLCLQKELGVKLNLDIRKLLWKCLVLGKRCKC